VQRKSPFSIPQAFDLNASTLSAQNRACRGGRAGCKILPIAGDTPATTTAFSLVELLVVIAIIIILAGLILSTVTYVRKKGARARAETEIAAMSAAIESYKADNGVYPNSANTISLEATGTVANDSLSGTYATATLDLYTLLTGDTAHDGSSSTGRSYFQFKWQMLGRPDRTSPPSATNQITSITDPFGTSYGYSTAKNPDVNPNAASASGYNPTFDFWTIANANPSNDPNQWIKNW
jgi:type II secretory pathway pseudopilin PulG